MVLDTQLVDAITGAVFGMKRPAILVAIADLVRDLHALGMAPGQTLMVPPP
jgi:hypothetical protein